MSVAPRRAGPIMAWGAWPFSPPRSTAHHPAVGLQTGRASGFHSHPSADARKSIGCGKASVTDPARQAKYILTA